MYEKIYNECIQHGTVEYDKERTINGDLFHFIGIVHMGDSWLFEFRNGVLVNVTLTKGP
jgi:hypothetical protein